MTAVLRRKQCQQLENNKFAFVMETPVGSDGKESAYNAGNVSSNPGEGNGNPLQYFCLGNPMDRGAWWDTDHRVTKSWTQLSD